MNKAIWAVLGLLVVVVLIVFLVMRGQQTAVPTSPATTTTQTPRIETQTESTQGSQEETNKQTSQTVAYTDSGFSPASLSVNMGDVVTFVNNSSKMMWIASAPHPTHTAYPGFDAKKGSEEGGSYTFTFSKKGTWKYHNHLNPSDFGTVIVE